MILILTCFDPETEMYFQLGRDSLIQKEDLLYLYTCLVRFLVVLN